MNDLTAALADALHELSEDRDGCDHSMFSIYADGRPGYEMSCEWEAGYIMRRFLADPRTVAALVECIAGIGEEWADAAEWLSGRIIAALGVDPQA